MPMVANKFISTRKRLTNVNLIQYQKKVHILYKELSTAYDKHEQAQDGVMIQRTLGDLHKAQDRYAQSLDIMEAELEYMPPAMCRLDENGMYIYATISDEFFRQQGWEIPKREEE